MDDGSLLGTLSQREIDWWEIFIHAAVISVVPVLLLVIFMTTRVSTQLFMYLADSWSLRRVPRYKDPLGAWKLSWNTVNWRRFCERMRRKDGSYPAILNCGPSVDGRHWVAISDPELIKVVLTAPEPDDETEAIFAKLRIASPTFADSLDAWIGDGLLGCEGKKWHFHRKACTPLFFYSILQHQLQATSKSAHDLVRALRMHHHTHNPDTSAVFARPWLSQHVMRCLLHIIAGEEATKDAHSATKKTNIDWMIAQQHKLVTHFRSSLHKTSFLGGRVWHFLGGKASSMLPWVGGEGSLHELQQERYRLACYFQSLINRLRNEEEDDDFPSQSFDLLSMLFNVNLDEDFTIEQAQLSRSTSSSSMSGPAQAPTIQEGTPEPPLPTRRSLLKSQNNLKRSIATLVTTPPESPKESPSSDRHSSKSEKDGRSELTSSATSVPLVSDQTTTPAGSTPLSPLRKANRRVISPKMTLSSADSTATSSSTSLDARATRSTLTPSLSGVTSTSTSTPILSESENGDRSSSTGTLTASSLSSLETIAVTPESYVSSDVPPSTAETPTPALSDNLSYDDSASQHEEEDEEQVAAEESDEEDVGWETSSDGSALEKDEEGPKDQHPWSTMGYNANGPVEDDPAPDEDPDCIPGSQPVRPGHLPDEMIIDQAFTFLAAGFQPITSTLEWCLYHLVKEKDQHAILQQEAHLVLDGHIPSTHIARKDSPSDLSSSNGSTTSSARAGSSLGLGDVRVSSDQLSKLRHTRNFIKEVLRLHPAQPVIERITTKPVKMAGHTIPEGTALGLMIGNVQRDPRFWTDPDRFWPERWTYGSSPSTTPKNSSPAPRDSLVPQHPFAYAPFSGGTRSCLGQKLVMQSVAITLAIIVRAFDLEQSPFDPAVEETIYDGILSPTAFRMRFIPRDFLPSPRPRRLRPTPVSLPPIPAVSTFAAANHKPAPSSSESKAQNPESSNPSKTPTMSRRVKNAVHL